MSQDWVYFSSQTTRRWFRHIFKGFCFGFFSVALRCLLPNHHGRIWINSRVANVHIVISGANSWQGTTEHMKVNELVCRNNEQQEAEQLDALPKVEKGSVCCMRGAFRLLYFFQFRLKLKLTSNYQIIPCIFIHPPPKKKIKLRISIPTTEVLCRAKLRLDVSQTII